MSTALLPCKPDYTQAVADFARKLLGESAELSCRTQIHKDAQTVRLEIQLGDFNTNDIYAEFGANYFKVVAEDNSYSREKSFSYEKSMSNDVDVQNPHIQLTNGVLTVSFPRLADPKPKKHVTIKKWTEATGLVPLVDSKKTSTPKMSMMAKMAAMAERAEKEKTATKSEIAKMLEMTEIATKPEMEKTLEIKEIPSWHSIVYGNPFSGLNPDKIKGNMEVSKDENNMYIQMYLPGVHKKDIRVGFDAGYLRLFVTQKKTKKELTKTKETISRLTTTDSYTKRIPDNVDTTDPYLELREGMLTISLPIF